MDKELIEKITKLLYPVMCSSDDKIAADMARDYTDEILALIRSAGYVQQWEKCPACHSDGKDHYLLRCDGKGIIRNVDHCNTCNGTGKVLKYAELAEDQAPHIYDDDMPTDWLAGHKMSQKRMLTPHKECERTTVFKRVYCDNQ